MLQLTIQQANNGKAMEGKLQVNVLSAGMERLTFIVTVGINFTIDACSLISNTIRNAQHATN